MGKPEGRATGYDSAADDATLPGELTGAAASFVASYPPVKQGIRRLNYEEAPPQPVAQYEGREGRTAAGISRTTTVGPRGERGGT